MIKDSSFKNTVGFILKAFLASWALLCVLYPDLFWFQDRRLFISHESEIPFESTYILVSHFFHGGIQLWDRFDQVNNAFYACTNGIYGVINVLTAFIFILLSPFFGHPGEALYHTHIFGFYGLTCLLRTIGGYLLLRKFTCNNTVIFIGILYLNTVLTSYMMTPGLEQQGVYSYFPLLLYCILGFFENARLRDFLMVVLVMCLSLTSSAYFTVGYFYQAVHFFILSCIGFFIWQRRWRVLAGRPALPRTELFKNIGIAAACVLIVLPYYYWSRALTHDFYVHGSGLGGTQGRFNNVLNFKGYFNLFNKGFANGYEFWGTALDYHHNVWGISWLFIGASTLFLVLAGLVLSLDRRKYIFVATIICVVLINNSWFPGSFAFLQEAIKYSNTGALFWTRGMHAHNVFSYGILFLSSFIHAVNALTNPFAFLVRSFHMASLLVPMLLLPLLAMGLQAFIYLWQGRKEQVYYRRRGLLAFLYAVIFCWALCGGTWGLAVGLLDQDQAAQTLKIYVLSLSAIFFAVALANKRWMGWTILGLALAVDFLCFTVYIHGYDRNYPDKISPLRISPTYTSQAIVPDYQNPRILPWREYLSLQPTDTTPSINGGFLCMYGAFYQYLPIARYFHPWSIYEPRLTSYRDLYPDNEIKHFLMDNPHTLFFADYGFDANYASLSDILRLHLAQQVVTVEPQSFNRTFLKTNGRFSIPPVDNKTRIYYASFDWPQARVHRTAWGWEYVFDLPADFPYYLSTSVFSPDLGNWRLTMGHRFLQPAQGELTAPFSFDVQNHQDKKLTVLLPGPQAAEGEIRLAVKLPVGMVDIWKNTYDNLGITYDAPRSGWLVFHEPYDPKWELQVDGRQVPLSRVNRYFIGAPMDGGRHKVLLRYWPHTPLRCLIPISMLVSCLGFGCLIFYLIKQQPLCKS